MTSELTVIGITRLDDHVQLADAGLAMVMVTAGLSLAATVAFTDGSVIQW